MCTAGVRTWTVASDWVPAHRRPDRARIRPCPWHCREAGEPNGVALGESFTCAILDNSTVSCWGLNSSGQLGIGASGASLVSPSAPLVMPGGRSVSALRGGQRARLRVVERRARGVLGRRLLRAGRQRRRVSGSVPTPTLVNLGNHTATDIAAGANHTCVILDNGQVSCWGSDSSGQLGNGAPTANVDAPGAPMTMPSGLAATAIAAGDFHTCVVLTGGTYSCWGYDGSGQLGNGAGSAGSRVRRQLPPIGVFRPRRSRPVAPPPASRPLTATSPVSVPTVLVRWVTATTADNLTPVEYPAEHPHEQRR